MRITERRLRSIIKSIIKENLDQDLSSSEDLTYLSDMGIHTLGDAVAYAMESDTIANETINRLMYSVIKESSNNDQELMNTANLINNQIKNGSEKDIQKAADKLSELKNAKGAITRMGIVAAALGFLGVSAMFAPLILLIIASITGIHGSAAAILSQMGSIGMAISFAGGYVTTAAALDLDNIK